MVQKLIAISNLEQHETVKTAPSTQAYNFKRMLLEKLDVFIQELFEQTLLNQAIQESAHESYQQKQVRLEELQQKLEACKPPMPIQELVNMQQQLEHFQREAFGLLKQRPTVAHRGYPVYVDYKTNLTVCGGVEMRGIRWTGEAKKADAPRVTFSPLETYINATHDEAEKQLIEETLNGVQKRINYLMPSKAIEPLNELEWYEHCIPVVIIHPIEGHVNMLKNLAKYIRYPVYGIQYTQQAMQFETVEQLAAHYWEQIRAQFGEARVHLCGYGFGGLVAVEMGATQYERCASLTVLDAAAAASTYSNRYSRVFEVETEQMELDALFTFAQQYLQILNKIEFYNQIMSLNSLEQRIAYVVAQLMAHSQFQFEPIDLEYAARSYVIKYSMMHRYRPTRPLGFKQVFLVRSGQQEARINAQHFLQQVYTSLVDTQYVDCDYRSFLEGRNGYQVASILNENLLRFF